MVDVDTFLTTLYVIVDDFYQSHRSQKSDVVLVPMHP